MAGHGRLPLPAVVTALPAHTGNAATAWVVDSRT
jgi:hypothetical protein